MGKPINEDCYVNVINEDLYAEILNLKTGIESLHTEIETLSKKFDSLVSLMGHDAVKNSENTDKEPENTDRESVINELSQMDFEHPSEAMNVLKSHGFLQIIRNVMFVNTTLHLTCYVDSDWGTDKWKIVFSD